MGKHVFLNIILVLLFFSPQLNYAIDPPKINATGNQTYCPGTSVNIVETVSIISDPAEPTIDAVYIQISSGYLIGQDQLKLNNAVLHPTIKANPFDPTTGILKLVSQTGSSIPYSDFEEAIKDVQFSNSSTSPSGIRTFSISLGSGQLSYLPRNKHFYEYVANPGITWANAKAAAALKNYYGLQGYLATLTAADEAQLAGAQAPGNGWIGGSDAETEGVWKWVTGPENGTVFWNGGANGSSPPNQFAFWNTGEPNNSNNNEHYAHVKAPSVPGIPGSWNDLQLNGDSTGNYQAKGYIVEYGGMLSGDIDNIEITASTTITIPRIESTAPNSTCVSGSVTLQAIASNGNVDWYTTKTGGTRLATGNSYTTPTIYATTSYYVDATNGNCPNVPRTEIIAGIKPSPTITSTTPASICDVGTATVAATASAGNVQWYDSAGNFLVSGNSFTTPIISSTTTYFVDASANGCTTPARTAIIATVNRTPSVTSTTPSSRCDTGTINLEATASAGNINWYDDAGNFLVTGNTFTTPILDKSTTYYVAAINSLCTSVKTSITATVYPIDKTNEEVLLCQGETTTLDASIPGMNYLWSPGGETTQIIAISSIGEYSVKISSPTVASCDSQKNFTVTENAEPIISSISVNENSITIELANSESYYEYSIDNEYFQPSNQFSYIPSGKHTAFVRDNNGCNLVRKDFTIFTIAKYFTPNNDGFHDIWEIKEMEDYPNSTAQIFDRYGKLIINLNTNKHGWDGKFNSKFLPADDYWYRLKLDETKPEVTGHFTLKR
jgi:gliding motility-associated-like protein